EERTRARAVPGGVRVAGVEIPIADILENRGGLGGVLFHADPVTVAASDVDAAVQVRRLAARALASAPVERGRPSPVLADAAPVLVEEAQVRAGGRAPERAPLVVSRGGSREVAGCAASLVGHQAGVVAALPIAEVAGLDVERRGAAIVFLDVLSRRIK